jgi:AraC-like DNA-binding protein
MGCPYIIAAFIVMQCCKFPPGKILRLLIPFFLFVSFYLTSQLINMPPWAHGLQASLQCAVMLAFGVYAFSYGANSINKRISLLFLAYTIAHTSYYLMIWMNELTIGRDYFVSLTGAAFMYGAAYLSFFYREPAKQEPLQLKLRNMLIERIEEGKLYLDNELRLPVLAEATGFSTHQISELINSGGENFADLINKYRVGEAKKLLSDPSSGHMTTEEVGYASGFNNKTSFYKHFKKDTGLSPMKYRMKHAQWITEN